jgi:4-amino-4-deoxy-L-arabinose transferase-like glycosyltransferase
LAAALRWRKALAHTLRISYRHLVAALLCGLALRLYFIAHFPFYPGDTKFYEELARNWLDHGVYGLFVNGQLMPVDQRMPGYPAFLAVIYSTVGRSRIAVMLAQAAIDLVTCVLAALIAGRIAPAGKKTLTATIALWLAALCPFTGSYTAAIVTETLAAFFTTLALLTLVWIFTEHPRDASGGRAIEALDTPPVDKWA